MSHSVKLSSAASTWYAGQGGGAGGGAWDHGGRGLLLLLLLLSHGRFISDAQQTENSRPVIAIVFIFIFFPFYFNVFIYRQLPPCWSRFGFFFKSNQIRGTWTPPLLGHERKRHTTRRKRMKAVSKKKKQKRRRDRWHTLGLGRNVGANQPNNCWGNCN